MNVAIEPKHQIRSSAGAGFTLIELLIVVAIIAILAAIAVPNFLEAQTRAKVSRVKADMRSVATALQAYAVDANRYPPDYIGPPTSPIASFRLKYIYYLTSPVAYMTSVNFRDPFMQTNSDSEENSFGFYNFDFRWGSDAGISVTERARTIMLKSFGPDRKDDGSEWIILGINDARAGIINISRIYDPTNGTVSPGDVSRFTGETKGLPEQI
ncbi:MAG: prepilin-type N-terminal cleavage/methylation domain-containing protein [Candidatus Sumerlaeaceae bacterium]